MTVAVHRRLESLPASSHFAAERGDPPRRRIGLRTVGRLAPIAIPKTRILGQSMGHPLCAFGDDLHCVLSTIALHPVCRLPSESRARIISFSNVFTEECRNSAAKRRGRKRHEPRLAERVAARGNHQVDDQWLKAAGTTSTVRSFPSSMLPPPMTISDRFPPQTMR